MGEKNELDQEQQPAFEILASNFVLGFVDEALQPDIQSAESKKNRKALMTLARRSLPVHQKPLCMFITGPAGAGKCKSIRFITKSGIFSSHFPF